MPTLGPMKLDRRWGTGSCGSFGLGLVVVYPVAMLISLRKMVSAGLAVLISALPVVPARADVYHANPKLVIVLVLDQFRGDYLERYRDDFKTPSGFNLFLKRGAYFTDCYYDYANTETAAGHSSIGTGAYSAGHGIALNQWWDLRRNTKRAVSSVEDERYEIVGDHTAEDIGTSPRNELASTLGDEVKLATQGRSKVYGISLKDRAAILTSGHASNGAFWLDHASGHFVSSTYWGATLPGFVKDFNGSGRTEKATAEAHAKPGKFYDDVGATPASVSYLLDFAQALITAEKMGKHETTDVLTISISSTDILGHKVGPDAPEQRAMIDAVDVDLNAFFTWLDKNVDGGMGNVWVSLTGDHGVGATIPGAATAGFVAASYNMSKALTALDVALNARFSPGQNLKYMLASSLPEVTLDPRTFQSLKIDEATAEAAVAELLPASVESTVPPALGGAVKLPTRAIVRSVYTKLDIQAGRLPATPEGRIILNSYSPYGGWYVVMEPGIYEQTTLTGTNHYTSYSYDRHVPLAFFGAPFVVGTYHQAVAPVDIATTFASLLRVNRPTNAVGNVLTFALKPGQ